MALMKDSSGWPIQRNQVAGAAWLGRLTFEQMLAQRLKMHLVNNEPEVFFDLGVALIAKLTFVASSSFT